MRSSFQSPDAGRASPQAERHIPMAFGAGASDADWPMFGLAADLRPALGQALARGPAVLATIVALSGGGPRPVGSQMVFGSGLTAGFLSGGCIEADVAAHAQACLADGEPRRLVYGEGSPWPDIRLLCGARVEVLVERLFPDDLAANALLGAMADRRPVLWASNGQERICVAPGHAAGVAALGDEGVFSLLFAPIPRLVVVGGDPTALATASLGAQASFESHLVRPKGPVTGPPLPQVAYHRGEVGETLAGLGLDPWSAVAVCSHDEATDHAALCAALPSEAFYVGLLGARRRLPERLSRLAAAGLPSNQLGRLRAPIGLDLGGKAPFEVAVAIVAEVMAARHGRVSEA